MSETMTATDLRTEVAKLKQLQEKHDQEKAGLKAAREAFEAEWAGTIAYVDELSNEVTEQKRKVEDIAKGVFQLTGEKKLEGGIGIREKTEVHYDTEQAERFAREKGLFLTLDKKAFEKAAPTLGLDFVKVEKVTQVTFPKQIEL